MAPRCLTHALRHEVCMLYLQVEVGIRYLTVTGVQTCAFFFSSRRRHTRFDCDWSSDVCSSDLVPSVALENFGDIRIPENGRVVDGVRRFLDKFFPVAVYLKTDRKSVV